MINRAWAAGVAAALFMSLGACAPAAPPPTPTYTADQFFKTTSYQIAAGAGFAFSPDGANVLISSDATGVFNAYALPVAGGAPVQLTNSTTAATSGVTYFPNDARILYTADGGGDELNHVYVRTADGQTRDLTPTTHAGQRLKAAFLGWKADGSTFYLTSNERNPQAFDVYAYDATTYARRLIFQNTTYSVDDISKDGRWLALVLERTSSNADLFLVDLSAHGAAAQPKLISQHTGNVAYNVYGFTPDSTGLVYSTNENGEYNQAWRYNLADGAKAALITGDWDVSLASFSPSGRYRVSALNADASTQLTILDTRSNTPVAITGAPQGDITAVRFNKDETKIAFLLASDTSPADVFVASLSDGVAHRLTTALNPAIAEVNLVTATVARYPSWDGRQIPGILYRPRTANANNKVPALVWVHGGPGGQSRRGYDATIQHLVNHGYAVFAVNNRGSSGYGKTFYHLDDRHHGDVDMKDVIQARAYLSSLDWIDGHHVGIVGGSYGGYMTVATLTFQPDAFDVGIDMFGVTNWPRTLANVPPWWRSTQQSLFDELGDPATDGDRLHRISPLFYAAQITKPILVIQGHNDPRVLQQESDELVATVRAHNVPVTYIVFPNEGHGFRNRDNRITASEAYLRFLDQYLKGQHPS